jgi:hypothetical protein
VATSPLPSSFELQERAMARGDHRAVFTTTSRRRLHVAPLLRHHSAAISTSVNASRHGDALGVHLIACTPPASCHHSRRRASHSHGDCALRGRRVPRPQLARPASGPRAQPVAKTVCRAGGPPRQHCCCRQNAGPTAGFHFLITFLNYLINRNGSKL